MAHSIPDVEIRYQDDIAYVVIDNEFSIIVVDKTIESDIVLFGPTKDIGLANEMGKMYEYLSWMYGRSLYDILGRKM